GSFLIGPWPAPRGGSSQSSAFDCQPKSAEANLGIAFACSACAVPAASVTAMQTAKPPADSPMQPRASDNSFDLNAGIMSSLNGTASSLPAWLRCAHRAPRRFLLDGSAPCDRLSGARQRLSSHASCPN